MLTISIAAYDKITETAYTIKGILDIIRIAACNSAESIDNEDLETTAYKLENMTQEIISLLEEQVTPTARHVSRNE